MAKAQSFADKVKKKSVAEAVKVIKLVFSYKSSDTGSWRFAQKFIKVLPDQDENKVIEEEIKNGKAYLEQN
jgi:predicted small secreted protein